MKQLKAKIRKNEEVSLGFYRMRIESPYLAKNIKPGQFIEVRCSDSFDPLLRRPFSVHRILKNGIEILYEVVGKGTDILSKRRLGEELDVIGPLGNGFDTNHEPRTTNHAILIAGGIGVAPLVALAESLAHRKKSKMRVLIGACKKEHLLCEREFRSLGCAVSVATEDGSKGYKGLVTDLLRHTTYDIRHTIYACGPTAMLKEVARIAKAKRIPCQVSLEERMACGLGVCLGCPIKVHTTYDIRHTTYEYKMVCKDGPVFNTEEIAW